MNCAEKLLDSKIFFNLYTKSPLNSGSKSPWPKKDLIVGQICNNLRKIVHFMIKA